MSGIIPPVFAAWLRFSDQSCVLIEPAQQVALFEFAFCTMRRQVERGKGLFQHQGSAGARIRETLISD